ncbi:MAG: lysophospholipid acyltransferase family protein, partial [Abditibacteriaceae bacterium]
SPRLLWVLHAPLMCTLRLSGSGMEEGASYLEDQNTGPGSILVAWHDVVLIPMFAFQHHGVHVIVSHSRSGQLAATLWRLHGWPTIWGSTGKREGITALRKGVSKLREGKTVGFTPDGPLGPRHKAQPGVVHLASYTGAKVVPLGVAVSRQWSLRTWDRHCIPKPFAKVHMHAGRVLEVPPGLDRDGVEEWRLRIENALREAQDEAARQLAHK